MKVEIGFHAHKEMACKRLLNTREPLGCPDLGDEASHLSR